MSTAHVRLPLPRTMATIVVAGLALASIAATCKGVQVPPGSMTATLHNATDDPATVLSMTFPLYGAGDHVLALENAGLTYLQRIEVGISPPGWTTDAALLQVFSRPAVLVSDDPPDLSATILGDVHTAESACGELLSVALESPSAESPPSRSVESFGQRTSVAVWLSRLSERMGRMPWTLPAGSPGCMKVPGFDSPCFDLGSVARTLTAQLESDLRGAFDAPSDGGRDPDSKARVEDGGGATLCGYLPRLIPGFARPNRRVRGFAFVFRLDFEARLPLPLGQHGPYHRVSVFVPIAFYFEWAGDHVMLTIDPVDVGPQSEMAPRVAVQVQNPFGTPIDAAAGTAIAHTVRDRVMQMLTGPASDGRKSDLLSGYFSEMMGPLRGDFDLILAPRGVSADRLVSPQLVPTRDLDGVDLLVLR